MKKISKILLSISLALLCCLSFAGCMENYIQVDGGTKVHTPTITNWYTYENVKYLDTSVNINFSEIKVADIKRITFELYKDDTLLGNAVSEGKNLETLLKDCAQYWDKTADTYTEVTGDRVLSCAFKERTEKEDNGFWVRSKCTATESNTGNVLKVKVYVGKNEYVTQTPSAE